MANEESLMEEILRLAECLARLGGYKNFSMRRLAERASVTTSSITDHFGSKQQLAVAVVKRFGARVSERVGAADDPNVTPDVKMATFIDVYRQSITEDGQLCLYLVFGTELHTLPTALQLEVKSFYANIYEWLETLLKRFPDYAPGRGSDARRAAVTIVASLNGAQICAKTAGDKSIFDVIVGQQYASGLIPGRNTTKARGPGV